MKKMKYGQNSKGFYGDFKFTSTMKKLTVHNAPIWVRDSHGHWVQKGIREITVGVTRAKDFDFEKLFFIATNPPTKEIMVA